jgi:hypothetical protein
MTVRRLARAATLVVVLALSACAAQAPVDTATAPPGLGLTDPGTAISYTSWAFALPSRTRGHPALAARAVAALDYVAGPLNTDPLWMYGSPIISEEMLRAREQMRRVLGIAPAATSQQVVDALTTVYLALRNGDQVRATQTLSLPIFTLGPERTLEVLNDLPYVHMVNVATVQALAALNHNDCVLGCYLD